MTTHDPRYTINREWISSHDTAEEARHACDLHHLARQMSPTPTQEPDR